MKPKNFPARKLLRHRQAEGKEVTSAEFLQTRAVRTKKDRRNRAKVSSG